MAEAAATSGKINVQAENIFPIIKKFLYSDHEIFLRELVSNAVDACSKVKTLSNIGKLKGEVGELGVEVIVDKEAKTITISDTGIGMSAEEVEKYIAQIAFSGAEEFVKKYKDQAQGIIGHFGLGFFSAFMVAEKVEVISKSHMVSKKAARWVCEGSPDYTLETASKKERGTDIILHIAEDSLEFLEDARIGGLLSKYCKFLPVPIKFGTTDETITTGEGDDEVQETITKDKIINNPEPAWTKTPSTLEDADYKSFYKELYPTSFEEPLFHIHLNVDYPFNLTGVLYFPKMKERVEVQREKIQLYSNQVYVTDSVEGIVPEFLTLLHGVIDSPDIPLNVSRSYLQSDANVKKISGYIMKKISDKLEEMFKKDREAFTAVWDDIRVLIEYGMVSEDKFYDRAQKYALLKNVEGAYATFEEYKEKVKDTQTDKDNRTVFLYTSDADEQYNYIKAAKDKGYDVLELTGPLAGHWINRLEQKLENVSFARVDADTIEKLINKDEEIPSKLTEDDEGALRPVIEGVMAKEKYAVSFASLNETDDPFMITRPEFMRRMNEMNQLSGGAGMMGNMPEMYNLVVNGNHPLVGRILAEKDADKQQALVKQGTDLALLAQSMLKGEALAGFIKRSLDMID